jgi:hypothetical protein
MGHKLARVYTDFLENECCYNLDVVNQDLLFFLKQYQSASPLERRYSILGESIHHIGDIGGEYEFFGVVYGK